MPPTEPANEQALSLSSQMPPLYADGWVVTPSAGGMFLITFTADVPHSSEGEGQDKIVCARISVTGAALKGLAGTIGAVIQRVQALGADDSKRN